MKFGDIESAKVQLFEQWAKQFPSPMPLWEHWEGMKDSKERLWLYMMAVITKYGVAWHDATEEEFCESHSNGLYVTVTVAPGGQTPAYHAPRQVTQVVRSRTS